MTGNHRHVGVVHVKVRYLQAAIVCLVLAAVALSLVGCAGTIRDRVRSSALMAGESALSIDAMERQLYAMNISGYGEAQHKVAGAAILDMLRYVRAYERAARTWPDTMPAVPQSLWEAQVAAVNAIDAVMRIFYGIPQAEKMLNKLDKARSAIGGTR